MAAEVISAIGLDFLPLEASIVGIREEIGSDAHFVLSSLLSKHIQIGSNICLVAFHHTFNHFHNVGVKLGYNLNTLKVKGDIRVVEPMKLLVDNLSQNDSLGAEMYKILIKEIEDNVNDLSQSGKSVVIVIDDLSHLFDIGLSTRDVLLFIKCIKSLIHELPKTSAIVNVHVATESDIVISNILQHASTIHVRISSLKTGSSNDISGKMEVLKKSGQNQNHDNLWNKQSTYHYKLHDRYVKVFAPGLVS